jgi:hypothetical protein
MYMVQTHFRKYCNPALRFSKNFGRNFDIRLFGGKGGIEARELGNVCRSRSFKSSNSEYRFRTRRDPPCLVSRHRGTSAGCVLTCRVSTVMFQVTKAPILVLLSFIIIKSSIYTFFAQHALFFVSSPSVLSCSVIAPSAMVSTDMLEIRLWCDWTQYGGEEIGDVTRESLL